MPGGDTLPPDERSPAPGGVNVRQKYAVKKGFSMLDWNLLSTRAPNLAGRGSPGMRVITKEELRQHKSEHDAWGVLNGRVYNITPFLHYHPGGVATLMQGAGKDFTSLFNKYHRWVNGEAMLGNLCLGTLAKDDENASDSKSSNSREPDGATTEADELLRRAALELQLDPPSEEKNEKVSDSILSKSETDEEKSSSSLQSESKDVPEAVGKKDADGFTIPLSRRRAESTDKDV